MFRNVALSVCLMGGCIWFLGMTSHADSAAPDSAIAAFKPVSSVESLMHGQNMFFKTIRTELNQPAGKKRNHEIVEAAELLAELANVNRYNSPKQDYRDWAKRLSDQSLELAGEAKKSDASDEKMKSLAGKMGTTCSACHDVYQ